MTSAMLGDVRELLEEAAGLTNELTVAFDGQRGWHLAPLPPAWWLAAHDVDAEDLVGNDHKVAPAVSTFESSSLPRPGRRIRCKPHKRRHWRQRRR